MGLFKPAWMSSNLDKATKAAEKEKNLTKLAEIAKNSPHPNAQMRAMLRLADQSVYAHIAKYAKDKVLRHTAIKELSEQSALAYVVVNDNDWNNQSAALEKLTEPSLFVYVAKNSKNTSFRGKAVRQGIVDQNILVEIANSDPEWEVRQEAVRKINDVNALRDIAKRDYYVRAEVIGKLKRKILEESIDQTTLAAIAKQEEFDELRQAAVEQLTDQAVLVEIASKEKNGEIRKAAVVNMSDTASLAHMAKNNSDAGIRCYAFQKVFASLTNSERIEIITGIINDASNDGVSGKRVILNLLSIINRNNYEKYGITIEEGQTETSDQYGQYAGHYMLMYFKGKLIGNLYAEE